MIRHILKDGTEVPDISGHVIKAAEHTALYEAINRIQKKGKEGGANAVVSTPD